jgi:hypothetical protein
MMKKQISWVNIITAAAAFLSLLSIVVYGTWFISTIERRVSILENDMDQLVSIMKDYKNDQAALNLQQDHVQHRFEDQITRRMNRLEDKLDNFAYA